MKIPYYHVDAFSTQLFGGNPAGVCVLAEWLPADTMRKIARENALAETAFLVGGDGRYGIRWFTPDLEMDLCGHATLAAAFVIKNYFEVQLQSIEFESASGGLIAKVDSERIQLDFPRREPLPAELPPAIAAALSAQPRESYKARDYVLLYDREDDILNLRIDRPLFDRVNLDPGGVCVTAKGNEVDFVSRFFTPQATILEDPVTGSTHCSLIPFWSRRLGKQVLVARQLSERGGELYCTDAGDRVLIAGSAVLYKEGFLHLAD